MSCCSNCGGYGCSVCNYVVNLPSEPPETLNFANINLTGIGVLASAVQPNIYFRGVSSANALLTVTLDAGNNAILLTVDSAAIAAALPAATETQVGVLETATNAEAIAKAATDKILVPSNLAAIGASLTFAGLVELATVAETQAGVDATRAVTPAGLAGVTATQKVTTTFADSVARAALVPTFKGQFGYQLDSLMPYSAYGTVAGNWLPMLTFGITNTIPSVTTTITMGVGATVTVNGGGWTWNAIQEAFDSSTITIDNNSTFTVQNSFFNLSSVDFQIGGSSVTANRLIGTSGAAGDLAEYPISNFVSAYNTQTGYTNFTNPAVLRTCDTATVTLPQLAQIVGTLINDLKARLLPAT